ncbi:suppressor of tub2 mutation, partial [Tulasnella sp. 419]
MITDIDGVIAALKQCLRTPNQLLTTATLLAIPSFVQHLLTQHLASASSSAHGAHNIRQALLAFLPSGGVIDRLGETCEKARDAARAALVSITGAAFKSSTATHSTHSARGKEVAKGQESSMAIVEKHLKELGLGSKGFRVREQTILALVSIRREHHTFPIRPYLSQLVMALEDTDGTVRDCAR